MMTTENSKPGEAIAVGDVLLALGTPHTVTRIEPYTGNVFPDGTARLAYSGPDWCITLVKGQRFRVIS